MSPNERQWVAMTAAHLDAVLAIENPAYAVPWTRGNFRDSLDSGHVATLCVNPDGQLLGYFVAMEGYKEMHLLNVTVDPALQGQGLGGALMDELVRVSQERAAEAIWLEVRQSNERAQALYLRKGFERVSVRRAYYPMPAGVAGREDAVVMSLKLRESLACR